VESPNDRGQASPEWIGVVLLVALAFTAAIAAGLPVPGDGLARAVAARLACAAGLGDVCAGGGGALTAAYGPELAALVTERAPALDYEDGMRAVPVDFRDCRADACAEGAESGAVRESLAGEPVTAFVHVIDCRDAEAAARDGYDCAGERAGRIYLQYWLYYPGSQTSRQLYGEDGFHPDDFESFQVRIGRDGAVEARASSHHGYNGDSGDPVNDTGWFGAKAGWTKSSGLYFISGGSHAGQVGPRPRGARWTEPGAIRLVPIEPLVAGAGKWRFEVSPPWSKAVYRDPEARDTG
jgi:hypothetical protein